MKEKVSILIADDNQDFSQTLSSYINKQDGIKKEVFILVLNCIFFLIALAVFLVITWKLLTFFTVLIFLITFTPCLIIVILTSILLKLR